MDGGGETAGPTQEENRVEWDTDAIPVQETVAVAPIDAPTPVVTVEPAIDATKNPLLKNLRPRPGSHCKTQHYAEMKSQTAKALGIPQIHTRLDESRKIWQAWAGGGSFQGAEFRGEWGTEIGAIRRLRNKRTSLMPQDSNTSPQAPAATPSPKTLDAAMMLREHKHSAEATWWTWVKRAAIAALVLVGTFGGGALWFEDRLASRAPRPMAPPAAQTFDRREPAPSMADVEPAYPDAGAPERRGRELYGRTRPRRDPPVPERERPNDVAPEPHGSGREPSSISGE